MEEEISDEENEYYDKTHELVSAIRILMKGSRWNYNHLASACSIMLILICLREENDKKVFKDLLEKLKKSFDASKKYKCEGSKNEK